MSNITTKQLVLFVIIISVICELVNQLRIAGYINAGHAIWTVSSVVAYGTFVLNLAASCLGLRTPQRVWWIGNGIVSIIALVLIGVPTVLLALWLLARLFLNF